MKSLAVHPAITPTHRKINDVVAEKNKIVVSAIVQLRCGLLMFLPLKFKVEINSAFKERESFCDVETLTGFLIGIFPP